MHAIDAGHGHVGHHGANRPFYAQLYFQVLFGVILGAVNFAIAAALFLIAGRAPSGRDIELANEIHDASIEALQLEARALQNEVSGAVHHPLSTIVPVLVPLIAIIVRSLRAAANTSGKASAKTSAATSSAGAPS